MSMNLCCYVTFPAGSRWEVRDGWSSSGLVQTPTAVTYRILGVSQVELRRADADTYDALLATKVLGLQPCFNRYAKWRSRRFEEQLEYERQQGWAPDPEEPDEPQTWEGYAEMRRRWDREELERLKDQLEKALADGAVISWEAH